MSVTEDQLAALRAFLLADDEEFRRCAERIERGAEPESFGVLVAAALVVAVARRFGEDPTSADIDAFLAEVHTRWGADGEVIDFGEAARLIRAASGREDGAVADERSGGTQVAVLSELVAGEGLGPAGLDDFLARARALAEARPEA